MRKKPHSKQTFRLDIELAKLLEERAHARGVSRTEVVEAALMSLLQSDQDERMEAALARRLDSLFTPTGLARMACGIDERSDWPVRALLAHQQSAATRHGNEGGAGDGQEEVARICGITFPADGGGAEAAG